LFFALKISMAGRVSVATVRGSQTDVSFGLCAHRPSLMQLYSRFVRPYFGFGPALILRWWKALCRSHSRCRRAPWDHATAAAPNSARGALLESGIGPGPTWMQSASRSSCRRKANLRELMSTRPGRALRPVCPWCRTAGWVGR